MEVGRCFTGLSSSRRTHRQEKDVRSGLSKRDSFNIGSNGRRVSRIELSPRWASVFGICVMEQCGINAFYSLDTWPQGSGVGLGYKKGVAAGCIWLDIWICKYIETSRTFGFQLLKTRSVDGVRRTIQQCCSPFVVGL